MKKTSCKRGFTLIELLVVVLIIGILVAVAVPQYQKAVEKSRAAQPIALLKTAYDMATVHYLETGTYPNSFDEMGMDVPWPVTTQSSLKWVNNEYVKETRSDGTWSLQLYQAHNGSLIFFAGLVKGKYAGAGFEVVVNDTEQQPIQKEIYCTERFSLGVVFNGDPGDYCEKTMHGTEVPVSSSTYRAYSLP